MIPIRDNIPSRTYPIVTVSLIVANGLAFLFEVSLGESLERFLFTYGLVPAKYFSMSDGDIWNLPARFAPIFTSMFLHGGWFHIIGNMLYLWIFGDNVEDRMGHWKFLLFYLLCGVASAYAHLYTNSTSQIPTIGASGAVSGVMGAYMLLYPRARIMMLVFIFFFITVVAVPAVTFLVFWVLLQFLSGMFTSFIGQTGGVAWWAHIGGFACGVTLVWLFRKREHRPVYPDEYKPW